jgi:hypothetical protein
LHPFLKGVTILLAKIKTSGLLLVKQAKPKSNHSLLGLGFYFFLKLIRTGDEYDHC